MLLTVTGSEEQAQIGQQEQQEAAIEAVRMGVKMAGRLIRRCSTTSSDRYLATYAQRSTLAHGFHSYCSTIVGGVRKGYLYYSFCSHV